MKAMQTMSRAALGLAAAGGVVSVGLMLRAGHRNDSLILLALFAIWVLGPFAALAIANFVSTRWRVFTAAMLYGVALILTVGSLGIYGNVVSGTPSSRVAFPFLVVPLGSWFLMMMVIPMAALISGERPRVRLVRWVIKAVAAVVILSSIGIVGSLGLLLWDHGRETTLPTSTGPFAVGRTMYVWRDDARPDPLAPQPGTKSELFVWIWYPAASGQPSETVGDYIPARWRTAIEDQAGVLLTQLLTRDLSRVRAHSIPDAGVSTHQRLYPVVLMRAGLAALTMDYSSLAEDLASHGYVVVGFDAPYRTFVVVFPDGRVIARAPQNNADLLSGPEKEHLAAKLVKAWSADMSFALDQLQLLNASDPSGRFLGRLDMQRIGVFGHSLGGATALQFSHDDSRCKAAIDVDGAPWSSVVREGLTQPVMFLMSDHSTDAPDPDEHQVASNFQSIFDRVPSDRRLQITIRGANHYMFSDDGAMLKSPLLKRGLRMLGIVHIDGTRQVAVTEHFISAFFDVYLKGAPASLLKSRAEYPEVEYAGF